MDAIPVEIICKIFLESLPKSGLSRCDTSVSSPLYISHVCRTWRAIALSYGELWSYLWIDYFTRENRDRRTMMVEIFDTWLLRTNGSPINFGLSCFLREEDDIQDHRLAEYMVTTLVSLQHRWKDVELYLSAARFSRNFSGLNLMNMPSLVSLRLINELHKRARVDITNCTHLNGLKLAGRYDLLTGNEPLSSFAGWSSLTFASPEACLDFLECTPSLTELSADVKHPSSEPHPMRSSRGVPRTFPSLRKLHLFYGAANVLDGVTLPSLENLNYGSNISGDAFTKFFQRSRPPLTTLDVWGEFTCEDVLVPVLRLLPSLKYLILSHSFVSARFFRELTLGESVNNDATTPQERAVCSNLDLLELFGSRPIDSVDECFEAFVTMMKSRVQVQGGHRPVCFSIHPHSPCVPYVAIDVDECADHYTALKECFVHAQGFMAFGDYQYAVRPPNAPFYSWDS